MMDKFDEENKYLKKALDLIGELVIITDYYGNIIYHNDYLNQIVDKSPANIKDLIDCENFFEFMDFKEETNIKINEKNYPVEVERFSKYIIITSVNQKKDNIKLKDKLNDLQTQLNKASLIHEVNLPKNLPELEKLSFSSYYQPAEYHLGGDMYDVIEVDHGAMSVFFDHVVSYVVDVTGHGLDSALLSTFVKDSIDSYFMNKHNEGEMVVPSRIIEHLKTLFLQEGYPGDYFVTILIGVFDLNLQEFTYSSAGMQYPTLVINRNNGKLKKLDCGGIPISSAVPEEVMSYKDFNIKLDNEDIVVLYTDGIAEQRNEENEEYFARLLSALENNYNLSVTELVDMIVNDFDEFLGHNSLEDDITLLMAHFK